VAPARPTVHSSGHASGQTSGQTSGRARLLLFMTVLVSAGLALGPVLLARGYVLVGDMTFVPRQPWKPMWLGLDGSVPRAVPADAFVSVLSYAVPGDLLQKAVLLAVFVLGGWGVVRLLDGLRPVARAAAALLYVWNPFVYERLAIGHWGLLLGLAALPWVVLAAGRVRDGKHGALLGLWLWLALAAFSSPTGGVVAGVVALVMSFKRGSGTRSAKVVATAALVNLPWIVPGVLGQAVGSSDPGGAAAFAARSDTPLGPFASLAGLGGIWKTSIVPAERSSWLLATAALGVSLVAVGFLWRLGRSTQRSMVGLFQRLLACGFLGLALAWLPSTDWGAAMMQLLIDHLPGAGLLRDSQKWLMPFVLVVAVGFGAAADRATAWLRNRDDALGWVAVLLGGLPLLLLPSLAWGQLGELTPVRYPAEWGQVASRLEAAGAARDRVVVLPWSAYVRYPWNDRRAALDPAIRFFPGEVITSDDLVLSDGRVVRGEDSRARVIGEAVQSGKPLAPVLHAEGVRWVLVEKTVPGAQAVSPPEGRVVHDGPQLTLVDVRSPSPGTGLGSGALLVMAVDLMTGIGTAAALFGRVVINRRRVG
jgi:hypothetical protein